MVRYYRRDGGGGGEGGGGKECETFDQKSRVISYRCWRILAKPTEQDFC